LYFLESGISAEKWPATKYVKTASCWFVNVLLIHLIILPTKVIVCTWKCRENA